MEDKTLYIIYDADGVHEPPAYGVFTSMEDAVRGCDELVEQFVKESLEEDPKESGIDPKYDLDWLKKEVQRSLAIQVIDVGANKIAWLSKIINPYEEF